MQKRFFNVVNGGLREGASVERSVNPRTGDPLWDAPVASIGDLDEAVAAAKKAFKSWSVTTTEERSAVLVKLAERIKEHGEELQEILASETGKSVSGRALPPGVPGGDADLCCSAS